MGFQSFTNINVLFYQFWWNIRQKWTIIKPNDGYLTIIHPFNRLDPVLVSKRHTQKTPTKNLCFPTTQRCSPWDLCRLFSSWLNSSPKAAERPHKWFGPIFSGNIRYGSWSIHFFRGILGSWIIMNHDLNPFLIGYFGEEANGGMRNPSLRSK